MITGITTRCAAGCGRSVDVLGRTCDFCDAAAEQYGTEEVPHAHQCKLTIECRCVNRMLRLEPDENCPLHGHPWPARCDCGRFVKLTAALDARERVPHV